VRPLEQRLAAAEHERRAVHHVARVEHPDRRRAEEVAREALVADAEDEKEIVSATSFPVMSVKRSMRRMTVKNAGGKYGPKRRMLSER
jgi:hypothetical protein